MSGPFTKIKKPLPATEREAMVRRCRSAFLDPDVQVKIWEANYPWAIRSEVLAAIPQETREKLRQARHGKHVALW